MEKMSILPKGWGDYPPEYNRAVHGPYDPAVYYGKRDTAFGETKLGDLAAWISRRNKSPRALAQAISRGWWRYQHKWVQPKYPGPAFLYQMITIGGFICFLMDFRKVKRERKYRYH